MDTQDPKKAETARKREANKALFKAKNERRRKARDQWANSSQSELRHAREIRQGLGGAFGQEKSDLKSRATPGTVDPYK